MSSFSPDAHPAVVSKRVSMEDVHDSFILDLYRVTQFEMHGGVFDVFDHYFEADVIADVKSGDLTFDITAQCFYTLFESYSQSIKNDGYFVTFMRRLWHSLDIAPSVNKKNFFSSSYTRRMSSSLEMLK